MSDVQIRAEILALRKALGPARVDALSRAAIERFIHGCGVAPEQWKGLHVGLYRPFSGELDLSGLEKRLSSFGARLCFPRVLDVRGRLMEMASGLPAGPREGEDPSVLADPVWPKGAYGNLEPPARHPAIDPALLDVIFVPGVAFGPQGERIGMGAGFYDRYLPQAKHVLRVALAFDFQLLPTIEQESWDQRVDWIWTERRQVQLRPWQKA